jgi:methionine synthase II (cobalamin-independent)
MEPFETFAVDSLPRPRRAQEVVAERREGLREEAAAEALLDAAVPLAVRLQGRAGLDVVSDGEWRREKLRALARGGELLRERYA